MPADETARSSKWQLTSSPFRTLEIIRSNSRSTGDAMRDLDSRHIITGDFLVVSGDVVSNIPLEGALTRHRARRTADKNAIMTMILREAGRGHRTKAQRASPVFVLDPSKSRCLHYEEMDWEKDGRSVSIDPEFLSSHSEIDVRNDLIDCRIDICTPDVLALWTDSFDYESPRKHFLYGVLKDYELNGKTIHAEVVDGYYAARIGDLAAYDAVSKDLVSRWAYPICPDSNLLQGQSYRLQRGNIYLEEGIQLARSCVIKKETIIGAGTSIGNNAVIQGSVIGRRCTIGEHVRIEGAHIWDDVTVLDGSRVTKAIVADAVSIGEECTVEPGALISFGARIGRGVKIRGGSRITTLTPEDDDDDDGLAPGASSGGGGDDSAMGEGGYGFEFVDSGDDDDDEEGAPGAFGTSPACGCLSRCATGTTDASLSLSLSAYDLANGALSQSSISTLNSQGDDDDAMAQELRRRGSVTASVSEEAHNYDFHREAVASIFDALNRDEEAGIVQLELQGLRMGIDAEYHHVRRAIIVAFMRRVEQLIDVHALSVKDAVHRLLRDYKVVFEKCIFDQTKSVKADQVDFLLSLQRDLAAKRDVTTTTNTTGTTTNNNSSGDTSRRQRAESILLFTVKELYEMDVLDEDGVNQWWKSEDSVGDDEMRRVRRKTAQFVDWLAEAEEDSDEEDDEDD